MDSDKRNELRAKLKSKINEKKFQRQDKILKEQAITNSLSSLGIDKDKLKESIEIVNKANKANKQLDKSKLTGEFNSILNQLSDKEKQAFANLIQTKN